MTVAISLLRGINVGGHALIQMDALRQLYESLSLSDVRTYVQSGNVVFQSDATDLPRLGSTIESAIEKRFGFRPAVIMRTADELRDVILRSPFSVRAALEPGKVVVTFFDKKASSKSRQLALAMNPGRDELHIDNARNAREMYGYFPDGLGKSKLPFAKIERTLGVRCTARNWNTVTKLMALADQLTASAS